MFKSRIWPAIACSERRRETSTHSLWLRTKGEVAAGAVNSSKDCLLRNAGTNRCLQAAETFQDALKVKRFSLPAEYLRSPHYRVLCPAVTHPCGAAGYITQE